MPCYFFAGVPIIKMLHTQTQGKNIETFSVLEKLSQLRFVSGIHLQESFTRTEIVIVLKTAAYLEVATKLTASFGCKGAYKISFQKDSFCFMWHRVSSSSVIESQLRLVLLSIQGIKYHHQSFKFIGHIYMHGFLKI